MRRWLILVVLLTGCKNEQPKPVGELCLRVLAFCGGTAEECRQARSAYEARDDDACLGLHAKLNGARANALTELEIDLFSQYLPGIAGGFSAAGELSYRLKTATGAEREELQRKHDEEHARAWAAVEQLRARIGKHLPPPVALESWK